jgi:hypothetical protein
MPETLKEIAFPDGWEIAQEAFWEFSAVVAELTLESGYNWIGQGVFRSCGVLRHAALRPACLLRVLAPRLGDAALVDAVDRRGGSAERASR